MQSFDGKPKFEKSIYTQKEKKKIHLATIYTYRHKEKKAEQKTGTLLDHQFQILDWQFYQTKRKDLKLRTIVLQFRILFLAKATIDICLAIKSKQLDGFFYAKTQTAFSSYETFQSNLKNQVSLHNEQKLN